LGEEFNCTDSPSKRAVNASADVTVHFVANTDLTQNQVGAREQEKRGKRGREEERKRGREEER
jgi:hypothetical protein